MSASYSTSGASSDAGALPSNGQLYTDGMGGPGQGFQFRKWLGVLWQGKWWILGVFAIVMAAGAYYSYSITPRYQTSTLLLLESDQESVSISGFGGQQVRQDSKFSTQLFVIGNSRLLARRVAQRLRNMETHPDTGNRLSVVYGPDGQKAPVDRVAGRVKGMVYPQRTGGESVSGLRMVATSTNPTEAALVANLYAEEYIEWTKERNQQSEEASLAFLEEQEDKLLAEVQAAERKIQEFMQDKEANSLNSKASRIVNRIVEVENQQRQLQFERRLAQERLREEEEKLETMREKLPERLSSGVPTRLSEVVRQKADLQQRIDEARLRWGGDDDSLANPGIERLQRRIAQLNQKADTLARQWVGETIEAEGITGGMGGGRNFQNNRQGNNRRGGGIAQFLSQRETVRQQRREIDRMEDRMEFQEQKLAEAREEWSQIPAQSIQMAQLQREKRSAEQLYNFVRRRLQETRLAQASKVSDARILREASTPWSPIAPNHQSNLLFAAFLGLGLGGGLVLLWEVFDMRIREPDDLRDEGHTVTGVVPSADDLITSEFNGVDTITIDGRNIRPSVVMLSSPMSAVAEAYRRIRANLRFARPDHDLRSLVVSSPEKGEGKTTTSVNLALAFASAGTRTLLVEADHRRARLHEVLDLPQSPGLSEVLYDNSIEFADFKTEIDHLSVVPAGESVPNPSELLGSDRMRDWIAEAKENFDMVIFDTPPLLLFSDGLALSALCDGTLVVAEAGGTDRRAFTHAVDRLHDVEATVIGGILNRYDPSSGDRSYGYNYGYAQGYKGLSDYYGRGKPAAQGGMRAWLSRQ